MARRHFAEERRKLLREEQRLLSNASTLYTKVALIMHICGEECMLGSSEMLGDGIMMDSVIRCDPELAHAFQSVKTKRTSQKEKAFKKQLIGAYGSESDTICKAMWCPVTHNYTGDAAAAHFVNVNVGEAAAQAVFGDDKSSHIWNVKNGLILDRQFARLIDNGKAVILPVTDAPDESRFQLLFLTNDIGRIRVPGIRDAKILHGRELVFRNQFRPAKKYLYFKFLLALLHRRRGEVPDHLKDLQKLPSPVRALWAAPGPYLKNAILYEFSRQLGCLTQEEANEFWSVETAPLETPDDETQQLAQSFHANISLLRDENKGKKDDDDSDDDDDGEDDEDGENDDDEVHLVYCQ
ncbi:hypothetical protein SCUCBS95973_006674 [Sporothrix curviconia]|uniref:HNH nuclease domain-containing protein n=1 Tax=Sporothrix curviconia TaxID=1260050 RepID=A0ABP0C7G4_9PEZI